MENHFNLPKSFETVYEPYRMPVEHKNWLILADIHIPFHNIEALTTAIEWGRKNKVDAVLLNGDTLDFYRISHFTTDILKIDFIQEIESSKAFLIALKKSLPKAKIYFKVGNHEERLENYLKLKAPELWGITDFTLEKMLEFKKLKIEIIKDKRIVYLGKLPVLHGHEIKLGAGTVSPARSLALKIKCSGIVSHLHQSSQQTETRLDGKILSTWSTGCLCELHPEYCPVNRWGHGFINVKLDEVGNYDVTNFKIIKGKLYAS